MSKVVPEYVQFMLIGEVVMFFGGGTRRIGIHFIEFIKQWRLHLWGELNFGFSWAYSGTKKG